VSVALGIQHARRVRHIVVCGLSGCTNIFPHFLLNGTIFEKKRKKKKEVLETKCEILFPLQILSVTFLILRRNEPDMIKN